MSATFRRSKSFGGIKLNFSKSGIGVSAGVKGLRFGIDSKGRAYRSFGIPGTGIYSRKNLSSRPKSKKNIKHSVIKIETHSVPDNNANLLGFKYPVELYKQSDLKGCLTIVLWLTSILLIPAIIGIFTTIGLIIYTYKQRQKPKYIFRKNFLNAVTNARLGKFEEAIQNLNVAEKIEPNNRYLIDLKGVCAFNMGDYITAKEYFEKLNNIEQTERTQILLSETYRKIDDPELYPKIVELNKDIFLIIQQIQKLFM